MSSRERPRNTLPWSLKLVGHLVGKLVLCLHGSPALLLKPSSSYTSHTSLPGLSTTSDLHILLPWLLNWTRWGTVILSDLIIPFLYSILHVCCRSIAQKARSIAQKAYLLPSWRSLLVISAFRKRNLRMASTPTLPLTIPQVQEGYHCLTKAQQIPAHFHYKSVSHKKPQSHFDLFPCLHTRAFLPPLWHIAVLVRFQEQSNPSSPPRLDAAPLDWAHLLPHSISFLSPSLPVFYTESSEAAPCFWALQPVFGWSSWWAHWGCTGPHGVWCFSSERTAEIL